MQAPLTQHTWPCRSTSSGSERAERIDMGRPATAGDTPLCQLTRRACKPASMTESELEKNCVTNRPLVCLPALLGWSPGLTVEGGGGAWRSQGRT